jgi:hypothetical protein
MLKLIHDIAIIREYQRILSETTGFPVQGEGCRPCSRRPASQSPLSATGRAVRHGDLDGSVPDLVENMRVSKLPSSFTG